METETRQGPNWQATAPSAGITLKPSPNERDRKADLRVKAPARIDVKDEAAVRRLRRSCRSPINQKAQLARQQYALATIARKSTESSTLAVCLRTVILVAFRSINLPWSLPRKQAPRFQQRLDKLHNLVEAGLLIKPLRSRSQFLD